MYAEADLVGHDHGIAAAARERVNEGARVDDKVVMVRDPRSERIDEGGSTAIGMFEDSEFVECLECREIFEASEFKDMAIEEGTASSDA